MKGQDPVATTGTYASKPLAQSLKSAKKRDAILRAAIKIINLKSFALATMSEIAATLDLRDASLYYYYPNKQALAFACHLQSLERLERMLVIADREAESGAGKLERLLTDLLHDSAENGPQLYFGDLSYLSDAQREEVSDWGQRLTADLERFVEEGIQDGSIVPCEPQLVVQLLLGMLIWLVKWVPTIRGVTPDRLMAAMGVVSLTGLQPRRSGSANRRLKPLPAT
ncbi:TetR/AcrR family transcriptional regulator [Caulobacter henricii]|uniref:TetR/AcrR family transcriptional regulator n=1 Tax=Caulobacter henricii TaxID=69395 RepID=UPI000A027D05|nr:TetR family transcriptional regulator [Caulobacter henricii]